MSNGKRRMPNAPSRRMGIGEKITIFFFLSAVISSLFIITFLSLDVVSSAFWVSVAVVSISAGVAAAVGFFLRRGLQADLSGLMAAARRVSHGDLTHEFTPRPKRFADEIDDLGVIFLEMQQNLQEMAGQIQNTGQRVTLAAHSLSATAEEMTASTQEIASTMADISRGTESQSDLVEQTSSGMSEMVRGVEQTEHSAQESAKKATGAVETAQTTSELANQALEKMREIFEQVEESSRLMVAFSDKLKQVSKIVVVIGGIAQKTTLLSLNATIEAAKAGEYGRGFAVVADEIRKLAETTTNSAEQITELIDSVDSESRRVLEAMQASVNTVTKSRSDVTNIGDSLSTIVAGFKEVQLQTLGISELSRAQAAQSQQMLRAMEEIQKVAENTAASTMEISAATSEQTSSMQEMSTAAQQLSQLAEELKAVTSRFRLGDGVETDEAIEV